MAETSVVEWRPIVWSKGLYDINEAGQVRRSLSSPVRGGKHPGHVLRTQKTRTGYRYVQLTIDGREQNHYVHRLLAEAFIGPCPEGKVVNHIDGVKSNNAVSNLEYVTPRENMQHASRLGLLATGKRNGQYTKPEMRTCGARNGSYTQPHRRPRGDRHGMRTKPESRTYMKGELHGMHKLTNQDVCNIRNRYSQGGITQKALGSEYGINGSMVSLIVTRKRWNHV